MILYKESYETAKAFIKTFDTLDAFPINDKIDVAIPLVVNGSFACELLFKSILPAGTRGHKLYNELFCKLEADNNRLSTDIMQKVVIKMQTLPFGKDRNYTTEKFKEDFISSESDFEKYRYAHEQGKIPTNRVCDVRFLRALIAVLTEVIELEIN